MKKNRWLVTLFVAFFLVFAVSEDSQARPGGSRSSGSRGSRGFAPRSSQQSTYSRPAQPQQPAQPGNQFGSTPQPPTQRNNFLSGLAGGVAGGLLGSMLFRGLGGGGMGNGFGGGGGFGILEVLVLGGLAFLIYRMFKKRQASHAQQPKSFSDFQQDPALGSAGFIGTQAGTQNQNFQSIESPVAVLQAEEPGFDLDRFKDERMDEFLKIQNRWGQRDLAPVSHLLELEIAKSFEEDLNGLRALGRINKIENVAVRSADVVEAWIEAGYLYATMHFRANLLDYTIDEATKTVLAGDAQNAIRFDEEWTFVRPLSIPRGWKLTAIDQV